MGSANRNALVVDVQYGEHMKSSRFLSAYR